MDLGSLLNGSSENSLASMHLKRKADFAALGGETQVSPKTENAARGQGPRKRKTPSNNNHFDPNRRPPKNEHERPLWARRSPLLDERPKDITSASHRQVQPPARVPISPAVDNPRRPSQPSTRGSFEPTFTNTIPIDDMTRVLMDFLFTTVMKNPNPNANVEIEAKLGTIVDVGTNDRLRLPVQNECVVLEDSNVRIRFESDMTMEQHRKYNQFLNKCLQQAEMPGRVPMRHRHRKEMDRFYEEETLQNPRARKPRIRVTTDPETGATLACVVKERIANLNIYSPRTPHDIRISVSTEQPTVFSANTTQLVDERGKDRISYSHQIFQIDLTQITTHGRVSRHELEVEMEANEVRKQASLAARGEANDYDIICKAFLDYVRILAREP